MAINNLIYMCNMVLSGWGKLTCKNHLWSTDSIWL